MSVRACHEATGAIAMRAQATRSGTCISAAGSGPDRHLVQRGSAAAASDRILSGLTRGITLGALSLAVVLSVSGCASSGPEAGSDYGDRYRRPLSSPGTQFSQLPPAVQHTVRAEAGSATITLIDHNTSEGKTVYRIVFQNADLFPPLYVASDGSVLYPNLKLAVGAPSDVFSAARHGSVTSVSPDDLPPEVVKAIQRQRPDAEINYIDRETRDGRVLYTVTFKGRAHRRLTLGPNGEIIE